MKGIPPSTIAGVFEQVSALKKEGRSIVSFYVGRPDFDTPEHIKTAAKEALDAGLTTYTSNYGIPELRQAIAEKLKRDNRLVFDPDSQIIVTVGANEGIFMAMMATLNQGDEVLIPDPMWSHYPYCARLAGARVVPVPLDEQNGYQLDPNDLEKAITDRTRMLVLNSPHNPTGVVLHRETIEAVAEVVERHGLLLISDEVYDRITYDGVEQFSPATIENIVDRTITVNGLSKTYAMTGWRLGYVAAHPDLISAMTRVHQYTTVCATSFAQAGGVAALTGPQDCVAEMVAEFDKRRRVIVKAFQEMPGASLVEPSGAFYVFPDISALGRTSQQVADDLLKQADVAVVPGEVFGVSGKGHLRISYACSLEDVKRGMDAMVEYWAKNLK
jgi:aminotransferase